MVLRHGVKVKKGKSEEGQSVFTYNQLDDDLNDFSLLREQSWSRQEIGGSGRLDYKRYVFSNDNSFEEGLSVFEDEDYSNCSL